MTLRYPIVAAALVIAAAPAAADPGDQWKKQWEKRAECEKKLHEAKSRRDYYQKVSECNRELAKLDREQRKEATKAWREEEREHRGRDADYYEPYYPRND